MTYGNSRLEQVIAEKALALAAGLFSSGVVYTPVEGVARDIEAQVAPERESPSFDGGVTRNVARARMVTRATEPNGVATVQRGARVQAGTQVYAVDGGTVGRDGLTRLDLVRVGMVELTPDGYRQTV